MSQVGLETYNKDKINSKLWERMYVASRTWDIGGMSQVGIET